MTPGKRADLVVLDDLASFRVSTVLHGGRIVAEAGHLIDEPRRLHVPGRGRATRSGWRLRWVRTTWPCTPTALLRRGATVTARVVVFGGPKTMHTAQLTVEGGVVQPDASADIASIAVIERHRQSGSIGRGFVSGLGISGGAVACTVSHDSHNLFVVGDSHEAMAVAANALVEAQGGYCVVVGTEVRALVPLPIAGLLSDRPLAEVASGLDDVERALIDELGCALPVPADLRAQLPVPPEHPRRRRHGPGRHRDGDDGAAEHGRRD